MVKDDFHPTKTTLIVFGEFETNVFRFVFWEIIIIILSKCYIGTHESVVISETVVGVIGQKRELLIGELANSAVFLRR